MTFKTFRNLTSTLAAVAFALASANSLAATSLGSNLTVDDAFDFYVSTNDSVLGTFVGSGDPWSQTYSFNTNLTSNVTNYIHVIGRDLHGMPEAFLGDFSLSNTGFAFVNGTQHLLTNTTDWKVSVSGFGGGYQAPVVINGTNGIGPWGTLPNISANAAWIWNPQATNSGTLVYFSTAINPVNAVPEPETYALMLAGLGVLGFAARRRQQKVVAAA